MWKQSGRQADLDFACAAANYLLAVADRGSDTMAWTIPPGYDALSGKQLVGYAHGAAGIADTLLDLYEVTHDAELLNAAIFVGNWLSKLARPALATRDGLNWPYDAENRPMMAFWCHGAAGVSRFLLHLHQVGNIPAAMDMAVRSARVVSRGTRWSGPTQCHGLAGNIECLIDMYCATGDRGYLADAKSMAGLLPAFAVRRNGQRIFVTDHEKVGPGFTHGSAGVAVALLRLADPNRRRHLLSVEGFAG
jgi:lantibiotic modifying enzyme